MCAISVAEKASRKLYDKAMDAVRWSLTISRETDATVRQFLASQQADVADVKDLSQMVEEAVKRYLLRQSIARIRARNAGFVQQDIMDIVDKAVNHARSA